MPENSGRSGHGHALLDAEVLKAVPGAQEVTGTAAEGFEATVVQKVGPVKATFMVRLPCRTVENKRLVITGEGKVALPGLLEEPK